MIRSCLIVLSRFQLFFCSVFSGEVSKKSKMTSKKETKTTYLLQEDIHEILSRKYVYFKKGQ